MGYVNIGLIFKHMVLFTSRRNRPLMFFEGREYTYKEVHEQACRYGRLFRFTKDKRVQRGLMNQKEALAVGLYLDNSPDFVFAVFGAAMTGTTIFGINTSFRGETLINCINQAKCALLIVDEDNLGKMEQVLPDVEILDQDDLLLTGEARGIRNVEEALSDPVLQKLRPSSFFDHWTPLLVVYTSGTTGAPKGVPCSHMKGRPSRSSRRPSRRSGG